MPVVSLSQKRIKRRGRDDNDKLIKKDNRKVLCTIFVKKKQQNFHFFIEKGTAY